MMEATIPIFIDTTILIARHVQHEKIKKSINSFLKDKSLFKITGLISRKEFRTRLLGDAIYLYELVERHKSIYDSNNQVINLPSPQHRKKNICLLLLNEICNSKGEDDNSKVDRALSLLRLLIEDGLRFFDRSVDVIFKETGCKLGAKEVLVKLRRDKRKSYEYGGKDYDCKNDCGIYKFLESSKQQLIDLRDFLEASQDDKSEEIIKAQQFINDYLATADKSDQPLCKLYGDLLISLESVKSGCSKFYTINYKESKVYCKHFKQELIYRSNKIDEENEILGP